MLNSKFLPLFLFCLLTTQSCDDEWQNDLVSPPTENEANAITESNRTSQEFLRYVPQMPYLAACSYLNNYKDRKECSDQRILEFIRANLKYPSGDICVKGNIIVRFVVQEDGSIKDVAIIRGIHPLFDEEALRVVRLLPTFVPGKSFGEIVKTELVYPIRFHL